VHSKQYGIRAQVNNIYTVGDYFFIDFSLQNKSNIKYDIAEIRLKLMDKKELKATNSQTIELTPVYMVNHADHFTKNYRNVIVLKKLTFPEEKKLRLEITEDQISGRVSYLDINYRDILNADSFASELLIFAVETFGSLMRGERRSYARRSPCVIMTTVTDNRHDRPTL
jgi:conjugative transposon TraN protein